MRWFTVVALWFCGYLLAENQTSPTNIEIGVAVLQPAVKRLGINLGANNYYDSGQMMKDLLFGNGGFEGQIWNSTLRCASGTAVTCVDDNEWSQWPPGFWDGGSFEVFYGAAAGRKGSIVNSTGAGEGRGMTLSFSAPGAAPAKGDYLIVRKAIPGGATDGWWPSTSGGGEITTESTDLPPGGLGKQAVRFTAPALGKAEVSAFRDTIEGHSFLRLNGRFALSFKAKALGLGRSHVHVTARRITNGGMPYLNVNVLLVGSWQDYTLPFSAFEAGSAGAPLDFQFSTEGAGSFLLDDASVVQTDSDSKNTTSFRDPVVAALLKLQPGILRFWADQLGDTLDNLIAPPFARQRSGFSSRVAKAEQISYGLPEFLALCEYVKAEPWFVVPSTFSTADAAHLVEYLAGGEGTPYGALRAKRDHSAPWTQSFSKIHLEFGNEAWNSIFKGGSIEFPAPYGQRAQTVFAAMRGSPSFRPASFDLVLGGQAAWPGRNAEIQNNCKNNDSFTVAPYTMNTVDSYADDESLFGPTFAEPEALVSKTGKAEGVSPGLMYANDRALQTSKHPVPLNFYEINLSTLQGGITQQALNSYVTSLGAGLMVADTMLLNMRQFGIVNQALFALPQYGFKRPDGKFVTLWGSVVDMGVTDRKRPQYLAVQLVNEAISGGAVMLRTTHSGANPTWDQPLVNTVQLAGAHYLQSFAFSQVQDSALVIFNLHRTSALPVTFSGNNAPSGEVLLRQLTSVHPTDTNENAELVAITTRKLPEFNPKTSLFVPPCSMTVLLWRPKSQGHP